MADVGRLAKNTIYMYIRMILIMLVSIYTSRVVLDKLGIDDYGVYNAVASVVAMVSFIAATLNTSTSRFLTFDLGRGDAQQLGNTFSTALVTHLALAGFLLVVMETLGLWYLSTKFVMPEGRETAVKIVYQISLFTMVLSVCVVPFTSAIIAHEDMSIYAYIGILDAVARLAVVYLLVHSPMDRLVYYALLVAAVQFVVTASYILISLYRYPETRGGFKFSKKTLGGMLGFTGWTALANMSNTVQVQGSTVLMNLFFPSAIIASKALANQVTSALMQFVNNFRTALNPQIIKSYSVGNYAESKKWTLRSMVYVFDLLLLLGLPCIMTMDTILSIWLVEVPMRAVEFTQWAIVIQVLGSLTSSSYIPFVASGQLKLNAISGTIVSLLYFILLYIVYKLGGDVMWVQYMNFISTIVFVLAIRPYLLIKELGYTLGEIYHCYWECLKVLAVSVLLVWLLKGLFSDTIWQQAALFALTACIVLAISIILMAKEDRNRLVSIVHGKLHRSRNES